jgi:hypothetical protein
LQKPRYLHHSKEENQTEACLLICPAGTLQKISGETRWELVKKKGGESSWDFFEKGNCDWKLWEKG